MKFNFKRLTFNIDGDRVYLSSFNGMTFNDAGYGFADVQVCGEIKDTHLGVKTANSSEGKKLRYISHDVSDDKLVIVQRSDLVEVKTTFCGYEDTDTIRIHSNVKNVSDETIIIEEASSFVLAGIGKDGIDDTDSLHFTRFTQSHHAECQPITNSFKGLGLFRANKESQKRISFANIGSWSTKEELPQGIIEDRTAGKALMFQIESNASWYYEIADVDERYYLWLGGPTLTFGGWSVALEVGKSYVPPMIAIAVAQSTWDAISEMTKYRRHISPICESDSALPTVFNEYMHLSWDSPTEENTHLIAPIVAKLGVKYYVIDCGWHNEEPGCEIYPYVGHWIESKTRFPNGIRATTDYIRSLGMKAGLWIEPEIIGVRCNSMLDYYDDSCFMQRNGRRISVMNRYFLDYRNEKVRSYMTETIRRMVEDYGADYIKCDYNQDCGIGTDYMSFCASEGLTACADAFVLWLREMTDRFPTIIFEGCASGGMRMDYKTLSAFSLLSTSDQVDYLKYPYIAGNVLSATIPEQAAVWSYPVGAGVIGLPFDKDSDWVRSNIDKDRVAMNMINSFLGRMHLASHIELLSEDCLTLVKEGIDYYDSLSEIKKSALPYFPNGFTSFGSDNVSAGLITDSAIYLAVWCLKGEKSLEITIKEGIKKARIAYPLSSSAKLSFEGTRLAVNFENTRSAIFVEIEY